MLVSDKDGHKFIENTLILTMKGVRKVGRIFVELKKILINPLDNAARYGGTDRSLVQELKDDFEREIRFTEFLPVIEKLPVSKKYDKDGEVKFYILRDGFNRITALQELGYTHYWFDVVEFGDDEVPTVLARNSFMLGSNAHSPKGASKDKDIYNCVLGLVSEGFISQDFDKIKDYIRYICKVPPRRAHAIANQICAATGVEPTIFTWTSPQIKSGQTESCGVISGGEYDNERGIYGWTVLEGYEHETVMNAVSKYHREKNNRLTNGHSYVVGHTKLPTTESDLLKRRQSIIKSFDERVKELISVCEYYNKNGKLPFEFIGFLPQTREEDEKKELIPASDIKPAALPFKKKRLPPKNDSDLDRNAMNEILGIS